MPKQKSTSDSLDYPLRTSGKSDVGFYTKLIRYASADHRIIGHIKTLIAFRTVPLGDLGSFGVTLLDNSYLISPLMMKRIIEVEINSLARHSFSTIDADIIDAARNTCKFGGAGDA